MLVPRLHYYHRFATITLLILGLGCSRPLDDQISSPRVGDIPDLEDALNISTNHDRSPEIINAFAALGQPGIAELIKLLNKPWAFHGDVCAALIKIGKPAVVQLLENRTKSACDVLSTMDPESIKVIPDALKNAKKYEAVLEHGVYHDTSKRVAIDDRDRQMCIRSVLEASARCGTLDAVAPVLIPAMTAHGVDGISCLLDADGLFKPDGQSVHSSIAQEMEKEPAFSLIRQIAVSGGSTYGREAMVLKSVLRPKVLMVLTDMQGVISAQLAISKSRESQLVSSDTVLPTVRGKVLVVTKGGTAISDELWEVVPFNRLATVSEKDLTVLCLEWAGEKQAPGAYTDMWAIGKGGLRTFVNIESWTLTIVELGGPRVVFKTTFTPEPSYSYTVDSQHVGNINHSGLQDAKKFVRALLK